MAGRIDPVFRPGLHQLMVVGPATRRSGFDKLKDPPKAATLTKFKQRLEHTQSLDSFGPTEHWLDGIPPGKIGHFAGEAKRLTLLASLIHVLRAAARDEVTDMFCKRMAVIHRKDKDRLEELREQHRAESERLLEVSGDVLAAAKDAAVQSGQPPEADQVSTGPDARDGRAEGRADGAGWVADTAVDGEPAVDDDSDGGSVDAAGADEIAARTGRLVLKALESAGGREHLAAAHQAVAACHGRPPAAASSRSSPGMDGRCTGLPVRHRCQGIPRRAGGLGCRSFLYLTAPSVSTSRRNASSSSPWYSYSDGSSARTSDNTLSPSRATSRSSSSVAIACPIVT